MWGIENYEPDFTEDFDDALQMCRRFKWQIIGGTIEKTWVAWQEGNDSWFADVPIILRIGGNNFEICWTKFADFAFTSSLINVEKPVFWGGGNETPLNWRLNSLTTLQNAVGQRVNGIQLIGLGVPFYLSFQLEQGQLLIYNAGDENGVSDQPPFTNHGFRVVDIA
jgi:hypothetical protein